MSHLHPEKMRSSWKVLSSLSIPIEMSSGVAATKLGENGLVSFSA